MCFLHHKFRNCVESWLSPFFIGCFSIIFQVNHLKQTYVLNRQWLPMWKYIYISEVIQLQKNLNSVPILIFLLWTVLILCPSFLLGLVMGHGMTWRNLMTRFLHVVLIIFRWCTSGLKWTQSGLTWIYVFFMTYFFFGMQFVNFTAIMSKNASSSEKETAFALAALMEIPIQYKATVEFGILGYGVPNLFYLWITTCHYFKIELLLLASGNLRWIYTMLCGWRIIFWLLHIKGISFSPH